MKAEALRSRSESRLAGLVNDRQSFLSHWRELANYVLPRRYQWLVTPNNASRGSPNTQYIIDSTGTLAARNLASGMLSGITSPSRPWFKLKLDVNTDDSSSPINIWLAEVERRMMRVLAESNFYTAMATHFMDLVVFGSAASIIYEDYDDIISVQCPCAGEYFFALSAKFTVDTLYREFTVTYSMLVEWFGIDNVSENVREAVKQGGVGATKELVVCHAIEPNTQVEGMPAKKFRYRELYWEKGQNGGHVLSVQGFHEWPAMTTRWDVVGNDSYGRSPAMDALGDIKQLQQETRRKAQAIDKMVNPPMMADVQLKNQPASTLPGGVTYVAGLAQNPGMKPIYQVAPPIQELKEDIKEIQERIKNTLFNDLFLMISNLQTVRSATEIDARREEKLIMLGPVLERFQNEALDPALERVYAIMNRLQLFPTPPAEIGGKPLQVEYTSILAEAQRAVATGAIERMFSIAGSVAAQQPEVLDNIDFDEAIDVYARLLSVPPKILRSPDDVAKMRDARNKAQQQQSALQQTLPAVKGAQVLANTRMNNGQSALDQVMGNGGPQ